MIRSGRQIPNVVRLWTIVFHVKHPRRFDANRALRYAPPQ